MEQLTTNAFLGIMGIFSVAIIIFSLIPGEPVVTYTQIITDDSKNSDIPNEPKITRTEGENGTEVFLKITDGFSINDNSLNVSKSKQTTLVETHLSDIGIIPSILGAIQLVMVGIFYFNRKKKK